MANRKFTQEFKDSTIQLALNSEKSVLKIGADLDVNPKTIYNWIREYKIANNLPVNTIASTKSTTKETVDEENKRLRAENKLLKQERDILKKATAYFAREVL
jgi:transposase